MATLAGLAALAGPMATPSAARVADRAPPQERAVVAALDEYERAVVDGDMAVLQDRFTLRDVYSGRPTDTDLRGTFVWVLRGGRWQLVTNQLTPVVP